MAIQLCRDVEGRVGYGNRRSKKRWLVAADESADLAGVANGRLVTLGLR